MYVSPGLRIFIRIPPFMGISSFIGFELITILIYMLEMRGNTRVDIMGIDEPESPPPRPWKMILHMANLTD